MKTRIHKWLYLDSKRGPRRTRFTCVVRYGVQVHAGGEWKHAHRNGKPLIFQTKERAEKERGRLRAL